jgi:hypothetical protein
LDEAKAPVVPSDDIGAAVAARCSDSGVAFCSQFIDGLVL